MSRTVVWFSAGAASAVCAKIAVETCDDVHLVYTDPGNEHPDNRNNNCVGCVKGGMGYWNKVRVDFPAVFNRMARLERRLDVAILHDRVDGERRRVFLDELDPERGRYSAEPEVECSLLCQMVVDGEAS